MEFVLRKFNRDDSESLCKYANNKKVANNLRNAFPHPYSIEDAKMFINKVNEKDNLIFAIDIGGEVVGTIGVFFKEDVYCKNAEVGYWLGEPFWGKGIMAEALKQLCSIVFEKYNIIRIYAKPYETNLASQKVLSKAGFIKEAVIKRNVYKNGVLLNSCIYSLARDIWEETKT
jgi:ribosomal-protein-alanine N-acetyltransferase